MQQSGQLGKWQSGGQNCAPVMNDVEGMSVLGAYDLTGSRNGIGHGVSLPVSHCIKTRPSGRDGWNPFVAATRREDFADPSNVRTNAHPRAYLECLPHRHTLYAEMRIASCDSAAPRLQSSRSRNASSPLTESGMLTPQCVPQRQRLGHRRTRTDRVSLRLRTPRLDGINVPALPLPGTMSQLSPKRHPTQDMESSKILARARNPYGPGCMSSYQV